MLASAWLGDNRVNWGGSWTTNVRNCRAPIRNHDQPGKCNTNLGFRLLSTRRRQRPWFTDRCSVPAPYLGGSSRSGDLPDDHTQPSASGRPEARPPPRAPSLMADASVHRTILLPLAFPAFPSAQVADLPTCVKRVLQAPCGMSGEGVLRIVFNEVDPPTSGGCSWTTSSAMPAPLPLGMPLGSGKDGLPESGWISRSR